MVKLLIVNFEKRTMFADDDDDDIAAALLIAASTARHQKKVRRQRRWWSITLYRRRQEYGMNAILRDLLMESESGRMQNFLRMSDADFQFLLDQISPSIKKQDTHLRRAITPVERFTITL